MAATPADLSQMPYTGMDRQTHTLEHFIASTYTDGFLVLKDGNVVCEQYFNNMAPHSLHLLNSVSKSFVGMLAGILVVEGVLDPQQSVASYVPELQHGALTNCCVQDALDMTAAVRYGEDYDQADDDFGRKPQWWVGAKLRTGRLAVVVAGVCGGVTGR